MTTTELLTDTSGSLLDDSTGDLLTGGPPPARSDYRLALATSEHEVQAAQRLRYEVFRAQGVPALAVDGMGSEDTTTPATARQVRDQLDQDTFDDRCDHILVWHLPASRGPEVVATYRLLPPHSNDALPRYTGLYANSEFGLAPMESLLDSAVEAGRAVVHPDHRHGAAVSLLWRGIAQYMRLTGCRYLLGCASIDVSDGGRNAASFWDLARGRHLAPANRRCRPRDPLPIGQLPRAERPSIPPLLRGYLRLGAVVCGPPAFDPAFGTADFLVLLDLLRTDQRYLRRYLATGT